MEIRSFYSQCIITREMISMYVVLKDSLHYARTCLTYLSEPINTIYYSANHVERKVPKYEWHKIRERKVKTLTRNWRDHWRIGTRKHTETVSRYFDRHGSLYQSKERMFVKTFSLLIDKDGRACRNISIQFLCACPSVISSISGRSFHFPFPYFVSYYSARSRWAKQWFLCVYIFF